MVLWPVWHCHGQNLNTMKEPIEFMTEEFFLNSQLTLDALNALNDGGYVADKDLYANGEILFFDMYDKLETREILRPVISDFKAYIEYNAAHFTTDEATELSMATLLDLIERASK
jgi:hypothetical protein